MRVECWVRTIVPAHPKGCCCRVYKGTTSPQTPRAPLTRSVYIYTRSQSTDTGHSSCHFYRFNFPYFTVWLSLSFHVRFWSNWIYVICCVCLACWLANWLTVLCGENWNIGHCKQSFKPTLFIAAMLKGTIDPYQFISLSTLALAWGHKVSRKQILPASLSGTLFTWSGWKLMWCMRYASWAYCFYFWLRFL